MSTIRTERNIDNFSRGRSLVLKIQRMWLANSGATSEAISNRIEAIQAEFDLTIDEWHYWCRIARDAK